MVTLANNDLNNNVSDNDSKIGESKEEERKVNLYTDSNQKVNKRVKVSDSFLEKVTDEPIFKALEVLNGRLKEYFVSDNVFNLSHHKLSGAEVSLLSKGLKFCPTPNTIGKPILKEDLEKFGRNLRLKWHYRNDNRIFDPNPFKPKSKFNPPRKVSAIKLYVSDLKRNF